jgi:pimeloyl-ACP methyl ester carboxylesterase
MGLEAYAQRFAAAGMAAFAFTYRHFGDSGGEPRQLLDIGHQLEDWAAALRYVRARPEIDPARIAIWGSSFGGGHVLEIAARDPGVAAVVSQNPFTDGPASVMAAHRLSLVRAVVPALRDELARVAGRTPVLVPVVGPPGSVALMATNAAEPGYMALVPPSLPFVNGVLARFLLRVGLYRPGRAAARVRAPILFCVCEHDSVAPAAAALRHARRAPRAEIKRYPIGHFEIYQGPAFDLAVADQTDFLVRHLIGAHSP